jgi:gamma-butyrobetaine dioxygenase
VSAVVPLSAAVAGDVVEVVFADGRTASFHRYALRDGCACSECRHPVSGQRLFETRDVVYDATVADVSPGDGRLEIAWEDGHRSVLGAAWLAEHAGGGHRPTRVSWGSELDLDALTFRRHAVLDNPVSLRRLLAAVVEYGVAVVEDVPDRVGAVADIAELFAHIRVTNYGRTFEVAVRVDATNLADTSLGLGLHTDNPYRDPVPTLQLLHCRRSTVAGGDTLLADGFRAVAELGARSPEALGVLTALPVRHAYRDAMTELVADVPLVVVDPAGSPVALYVNGRSRGVPSGPPELVAAWYDAYAALLAELDAPAARVQARLRPGDVLVLDNRRVLHGRTAFAGDGERLLEGCYADQDGLRSMLAVLEREAA